MICPSCSKRYAPKRKDRWVFTDDPFTIKPESEAAEKEWQALFDSDIKCPCTGCSI